jgi:hypothetical protein
MINYNLKARNYIVDEIKKEFCGPGSEEIDSVNNEEERISENPINRYFLGVLYPQKMVDTQEEIEDLDGSDNDPDEREDMPETEDDEGIEEFIIDEKDTLNEDLSITAANQFCPSSYGMTFFINGNNTILDLSVMSSKYVKLNKEEQYVKLTESELSLMHKFEEFGCYKIIEDKFYFISFLNKEQRAQLKHYSKNIFLESLTKNEKQKLIEKENHKKLTAEDRLNYDKIFLLFSRIHDKAKNFQRRGYRRTPLKEFNRSFNLSFNNLNILEEIDSKDLTLRITNRPPNNRIKKITISVINNKNFSGDNKPKPELCYFQNRILVKINSTTNFEEISRVQISQSADPSDAMLYSNKKIFAVGHGCSVNWNGNNPVEINTEFIPSYEVPQTDPAPERINNLGLNIFNMKYLAFDNLMNKKQVISELNIFANDYSNWLDQQGEASNDKPFYEYAKKNINVCQGICKRLREGINLLQDVTVWKSFQLANEAMVMQRYNSVKYVNNPKKIIEPLNELIKDYSIIENYIVQWRPFQLAFFLLVLKSITEPQSEDRNIADLLWFPTGGGKTEAYLAVIAFTLFYRRLTGGKLSIGTSVIMRYTLRLLTAQQFQRASTLICACEKIRALNTELGKEPITIGLWVGSANTPNDNQTACEYVNKLSGSDTQNIISEFENQNPFQVQFCPWCGTSLLNHITPLRSGYRAAKTGANGFYFKCINPDCDFSERLPLQVVDELIYRNPPSLLFATVDKFARLAWLGETQKIFGIKGTDRFALPPDLILQDELHLIAGPLGSMFGLYESVLDYLCSYNGRKPKIICSTATIKRADDQIGALFNRRVNIFPPSAIIIEDSYFSKEIPVNLKPGRLYIGLISIGKTLTTTQVKILYTLLYHNLKVGDYLRKLEDNPDNSLITDTIDSYFTIISYYNSIRDLGHSTGLFNDDVKEKIQMLQDRRREIFNRPLWFKELTSRESSKELPKILKTLQDKKYPEKETIPAIFSTNMFSVGVDISRLNLMLMNGQPKSSSEYIQATSRIGRKDPGLVVTLFDNFRPRDKSHYENFISFHQSFYRFVEPTGVTPFSLPARKRGIHTLLIIIARLLGGLTDNQSASNFTSATIPDEFIEFILERVKKIDSEETGPIETEINHFIDEWQSLIHLPNLVFSNRNRFGNPDRSKTPLMRNYGEISDSSEREAFPVLHSLRNVDVPTICKLKD